MSNTTFIIIDKNGVLKQQSTRTLTRECLYKKCGFRKSEGFEQIHTWTAEEIRKPYTVELWGKDTGKTGQENTYSFQIVNDTNVYYGTLALIAVDTNNNVLDLYTDTWQEIENTISSANIQTRDNVPYKVANPSILEGARGDDESNSDALSSGSELEEEEYYYSDS